MNKGQAHGAVLVRALTLFAVVLLLAVAAAGASTGGVGSGGGGTTASSSANFGSRSLRKGDRGGDVKTLNWVLKSLSYGKSVKGRPIFNNPTDRTVRKFQHLHGMGRDGVVRKSERKALAGTLLTGDATYYTLFGNRTYCGQTLTKHTIGFATPTGSPMKCGSRVVFKYKGRWVRAKKIDTGPGVRCFDLTYGLKQALRFPAGRANVHYARVSGAPPC